MIKREITSKNEIDITIVLNRLKVIVDCKSDKELASKLGVSQGTFSNWKTRNTFDYNLILTIALKQKIDLNFLFTGLKTENKLGNSRYNSQSFFHHANTRNNLNIKKLLIKYRHEGYGAYWILIEILGGYSNKIKFSDLEAALFGTGIKIEFALSIIKDFDLFYFDDEYFSHSSPQESFVTQLNKNLDE